VGFGCLFLLLPSRHSPVNERGPIDPQKRNTLASGIKLFFVLFALMQKVRKKIKANPNPSGSLAGLTPPPVGLVSLHFYHGACRQVGGQHKCLLVAGSFLTEMGMPFTQKNAWHCRVANPAIKIRHCKWRTAKLTF
jgi:hypothetical protein